MLALDFGAEGEKGRVVRALLVNVSSFPISLLHGLRLFETLCSVGVHFGDAYTNPFRHSF